MLDSVSWIVHPLGGMTLAFLASLIFSRRGRQSPGLLGALLLLLALSVLGAGWLVHPAAALTLALLASTVFHAWRREWQTVVASLIALAVFAALGAEWAVFPLMGLGLAWLLKVVFSGELFRTAAPAQEGAGLEGAVASLQGSPAALPGQSGGEAFVLGPLSERMAARIERKMQRRAEKWERKAGRSGVPLRVRLEKAASDPAPAVQSPAAQPPAAQPAASALLLMSRDERLPEGARARLGALHFRCQEALEYLKEHDQDGAGTGFMLRQIETDYAPEAVKAYLKLPPSLAGVTPLQDGKTGRDLLNEQLDLLLNAVQDIMQGAARAGSQHLLAHQRFLKDRFAKPSDELKL